MELSFKQTHVYIQDFSPKPTVCISKAQQLIFFPTKHCKSGILKTRIVYTSVYMDKHFSSSPISRRIPTFLGILPPPTVNPWNSKDCAISYMHYKFAWLPPAASRNVYRSCASLCKRLVTSALETQCEQHVSGAAAASKCSNYFN